MPQRDKAWKEARKEAEALAERARSRIAKEEALQRTVAEECRQAAEFKAATAAAKARPEPKKTASATDTGAGAARARSQDCSGCGEVGFVEWGGGGRGEVGAWVV
jgi:membrane protein involved in colicin uptake